MVQVLIFNECNLDVLYAIKRTQQYVYPVNNKTS